MKLHNKHSFLLDTRLSGVLLRHKYLLRHNDRHNLAQNADVLRHSIRSRDILLIISFFGLNITQKSFFSKNKSAFFGILCVTFNLKKEMIGKMSRDPSD